ncbi:MAG: hypothetical protein FJ303_27830 [Planctomycetes bacterium]|nr:hypothetical protein [Planctomycetota bacterium]
MKPPNDLSLPFFAYGVFKPGELAFLQIKALVENCADCSIPGTLRIRDGLPIASLEQRGEIRGARIAFRPSSERQGYQRIADLEPGHQYRWETVELKCGKANVLAGRSPKKGSVHPEEEWSGRNDPLFTDALVVVSETFEKNRQFEWDLKPLFRLEMAYLLLWSAIERYASLRYHLGDKATKKVLNLASEPAFQAALLEHVRERREVQRADNPTEKHVLDGEKPTESLSYYYQLRHNLVHRGKGVTEDHKRMENSLDELLKIFKATLSAAFAESQWPATTN